MNDFTKEELEWLYESVDYCIEEFQEQNPAYSVRDKLKFMIDNHCEHDGVIGKDYPAEKCMKCNRMWE